MTHTIHSSARREPEILGSLQRDRALHLYRQMVRIRLFEEQVNELYITARMPGLAHLYIGRMR